MDYFTYLEFILARFNNIGSGITRVEGARKKFGTFLAEMIYNVEKLSNFYENILPAVLIGFEGTKN